ncbi:MAG TPA: glycoside hydrolase family 15 protein [Myxococcales bacterium]|nr:glycoside hydrolase family 15 protein [Myxococcales bacterium]
MPFVRTIACAASLLLLAGTARAAGFDHGTVSNGWAAATIGTTTAQVDAFYPHLYAAHDPQTTTPSLLQGVYFGLRADGSQSWLYQQPVAWGGYPGQGTVFELIQAAPGQLTAESYAFAPDDFPAPAIVVALHVTNGSAATLSGGAAFLFVSPSVGGGTGSVSSETLAYDDSADAFTLAGASGSLVALSLSPSAHHGESPTDVIGTVNAGNDLPDTSGPTTQDDAAAAWEWALPALGPGQDAWVGAIVLASGSGLATLQGYVDGRSVQALVQAQEQRDAAALAAAQLPAGSSPAETQVAQQQLSILRMAQVQEPNGDGGSPHGALLASLPPGQWTITWVRDSCYAIVALARAGLVQQAVDALSFLLSAQVGGYQSYVGRPYGVSVCRHYGDGEEWSDTNQDGPNVELDGFGLVLWATKAVLDAGGATASAALAPFASRLIDLVATPLSQLTDGTGLITPDSSIWEVHWDGQQQHFTFTDAAAVAGLAAAPSIARAFGLADPGFGAAARSLALAMQAKLVDGTGAFAGTLEGVGGQGDDHDAAAIEAYALAGLDPTATIAAVQADLGVASGLGYRRDDQGSSYDESEWAFVDLRLAAAEFGIGQVAPAQKLLDRVTDAAQQAYGLIPELYDPATGAYAGAVPMVGFGAAAYLLALQARAAGVVSPTDWSSADAGTLPSDGGETSTQADAGHPLAVPPPGSCGCGSAGGEAFALILAILALSLRRRPGRGLVRAGRPS